MSELTNLLIPPFNLPKLSLKRKKIKNELLADGSKRIVKKIAVLGGSTTHDVIDYIELFCLKNGIEPSFYESEYNQYYADVMFNNELREFNPDLIFIHTSYRNLFEFLPTLQDSIELINDKLNSALSKWQSMWDKISAEFKCPVIQNNFELPAWRLMGNKEFSDFHGTVNFVTRLNIEFAKYAQTHNNFYINDLNYISASYGLDQWHDLADWYMYKYCCKVETVPLISFSVANIIKSLYGKNKKGFVLDLDNTLWGGIVGDDGVENLELGEETAPAEGYTEFQKYLKSYADLGVILNIDSKNEYDNAIAGLKHPQSVLAPDDFISIKANWEPKNVNLENIANELALLPESLVFVDDNPAEREIVRANVQGACVPEVSTFDQYIKEIDRQGFFEVTTLSADDKTRTQMYKENAQRAQLQASFDNYDDYLKSLEMVADIKFFEPVYMARIAQLTNKSNQFNLTTKRYTQADIETTASDGQHICLYGKLKDKFGDNGVVAISIGKIKNSVLEMELWLMSCRVLKRGMELAMLDRVAEEAIKKGLTKIRGYYYKTPKNAMVKELYKTFGFELVETSGEDTVWELDLANYQNRQSIIDIIKE